MCNVASTTCCLRAAVIWRLRPRPGASRVRAVGPPDPNRRRHNRTVSWLVSSRRAMCLLGSPSAASNTIRLRNTTRCAVVPARIQRSNVARCSVVIGKAGARFMRCTVPNPGWKYKTFHDHYTSSAPVGLMTRCGFMRGGWRRTAFLTQRRTSPVDRASSPRTSGTVSVTGPARL